MSTASWPRRVLWHSAPPWAASAFGSQTRAVVRQLVAHGVDVRISVATGLDRVGSEWEGCAVVPAPTDVPGSLADQASAWLDVERGDRLVTFVDPWRLGRERLAEYGAAAWTALESVPASPSSVAALRASGVRPVAVSRHVASLLADAGFGPVPVLPHVVDTAVFTPLVAGDRLASRSAARRLLDVPIDAFVVGTVVANAQPELNRKSLPEVVQAFAVHARTTERPLLWIHGPQVRGGAGGIHIDRLVEAAGLPAGSVRTTEPADLLDGGDAAMAVLYNSFDVLCQPSAGEGFCLPLLESQACGVPVIATKFAAQPEVVGAGWLVEGQPRWVASLRGEMRTPWIDQLVGALAEAATTGPDRFDEATAFAAEFGEVAEVDRRWFEVLTAGESWS